MSVTSGCRRGVRQGPFVRWRYRTCASSARLRTRAITLTPRRRAVLRVPRDDEVRSVRLDQAHPPCQRDLVRWRRAGRPWSSDCRREGDVWSMSGTTRDVGDLAAASWRTDNIVLCASRRQCQKNGVGAALVDDARRLGCQPEDRDAENFVFCLPGASVHEPDSAQPASLLLVQLSRRTARPRRPCADDEARCARPPYAMPPRCSAV